MPRGSQIRLCCGNTGAGSLRDQPKESTVKEAGRCACSSWRMRSTWLRPSPPGCGVRRWPWTSSATGPAPWSRWRSTTTTSSSWTGTCPWSTVTRSAGGWCATTPARGSSCSPRPGRWTRAWAVSSWGRTTTSPSPSSSLSWWPGCGPWGDAASRRAPRSSRPTGCAWIPSAGRSTATGTSFTSAPRSSRSFRSSWRPRAGSSAPRRFWRRPGTPTPTPSPTPRG